MEKKPHFCRKCKEILSPLYRFSCDHKLCIECIYRTLFSDYMQSFSLASKKIDLTCFCAKKGSISLSQEQIIEIINSRNINDKLKPCKEHTDKIRDHYCRECNVPVCFECCLSDKNEHKPHIHSVESCEVYAVKIKTFFSSIPLKSIDAFLELIDKVGVQFKKTIENDYNSTLNQIDIVIQEAINVRSAYASNYKRLLSEGVNSLKIIKMFYLNYYYDFLKRSEKSSDINFLKYLNNIKYQLNDASIKQNESIARLIKQIQMKLDEIKVETEQALRITFDFSAIPNIYTPFQVIPDAHEKIVSAVIQGNDETIITGGADYFIKIWEQTNLKYNKVFEIKQSTKQILALLQIKDSRIWSSSYQENIIRIWVQETEGYKCQQTLTLHSKSISTLLSLRDERILSGSLDNSIIIWRDTGKSGFQSTQKLTLHSECIYALIELYDLRIASAADDGCIHIWKEEDSAFRLNHTLNRHSKKIRALCQLKDGRIASGGEESTVFLWKPNDSKVFAYHSELEGHTNSVNVIILLSDGRLASASKDYRIIIWKMENEVYAKSEVLESHTSSVYVLIQLKDGRLCTGGSDCSIILWKNRENLI